MKLAIVLLMVCSLVAVYGLADPARVKIDSAFIKTEPARIKTDSVRTQAVPSRAPTVRGKVRAKSQLRSRTGTRIRVDNTKLKSEQSKPEYIPTTELTPITETIPTTQAKAKAEINLVTTVPTTTTTERIPTVSNATIPAPFANPECQQNDMLNRLLLRVLLSSMVTTTTSNPLMDNLNRLFNISPSSPISPTTVITSTAISTVTQLFSTIVSVMFRNRKLPTTIFSSSTLVVTEIQTVTSTLPLIDPPSLFRFKREAGVENQLQSSIPDDNSIIKMIEPTLPLPSTNILDASDPVVAEPAIDIDRLMVLLNQPEIRDAWNQFLQVLHRVL